MSCLEVLIGIEIYALPKFILSPYFSLFPELVLMGIEILSFRTVVFHLALVKKRKRKIHFSRKKIVYLTNYNLVIKISSFCSIHFCIKLHLASPFMLWNINFITALFPFPLWKIWLWIKIPVELNPILWIKSWNCFGCCPYRPHSWPS